MSRFSEYLEKIIIRSGMKEKDLARISGFARSYIALMKNGQRVSPDTEKMMKLMMALNLPPYEVEIFKEEYYRARIGDEAYDRDMAVMDFLQSFNNKSTLEIKAQHSYDIPNIRIIDNQTDVEKIIKAIIGNEACKENGFIHIIMQSEGNILKDVLPEIYENNKSINVEQIVCMEQYSELALREDQLYNIKMLKDMIPTIVFANNQNYRIYYYYNYVASRFNTGKLLPCMILTSEHLLCMNSDLSMGFLTKEQEMKELYEQLFQKNKAECKELILYFENELAMQSYQIEKQDMESVTYSIAQQPCFGILKLDNIVKKYMNRMNRVMLMNLEKMLLKNNQKIIQDNNKHISYCTKEGIRRFAEEGVIDEVPAEIYKFLQKEDRKYILQMLVSMIEEEKCELYFMEDSDCKIPKELFINIYSEQDMLILYLSDNKDSRFIIKESSLTKTFYESLKYMHKNPKACSSEEAVTYIRNIIEMM